MAQAPEKSCSQCRARKRKCDLTFPRCSNCAHRGIACEFAQRKKPGPRKRSTLRSLISHDAPSADYAYDSPASFTHSPRSTDPLADLELPLLEAYGSMRLFPYLPPLQVQKLISQTGADDSTRALIQAACAISLRSSASCNLTPSFNMRLGASETFAKRAKALFLRCTRELESPPNLNILKTALILAFYDISVTRRAKSWLLVGEAVRLAIEMGLDRLDSGWHGGNPDRSVDELEESRIVWWCVYALDTFISSILHRPFAITDADIDTAILSPLAENLKSSKQLLFLPPDLITLQREVQSLDFADPLSFKRLSLLLSCFGRSIFTARRQQLRGHDPSQQFHLLENTLATCWFAIPNDTIEQAAANKTSDLKILQTENLMKLHLFTLSIHSYVLLQDNNVASDHAIEPDYSTESSNVSLQSIRWERCIHASLGITELIRRLTPEELCQMSPVAALILWLPAVTLVVQTSSSVSNNECLLAASAVEVIKAALQKLGAFWRIAQDIHDAICELSHKLTKTLTRQEMCKIMCSYTSPLENATNGIPEVRIPSWNESAPDSMEEFLWHYDSRGFTYESCDTQVPGLQDSLALAFELGNDYTSNNIYQ